MRTFLIYIWTISSARSILWEYCYPICFGFYHTFEYIYPSRVYRWATHESSCKSSCGSSSDVFDRSWSFLFFMNTFVSYSSEAVCKSVNIVLCSKLCTLYKKYLHFLKTYIYSARIWKPCVYTKTIRMPLVSFWCCSSVG